MVFNSRTRLALGLAVAALLALLPGARVEAQPAKADAKRVTFKTADGVELAGTYYPSGGKKEATVLFLHHFDPKGGGNSHTDGWDKLAERLQKEGYSVLSFDFRGFGESKSVDASFWANPKFRDNMTMVKRKGKGETIDQKDFNGAYYVNLVQDVAAAKAFLDRKNDAREVNSSNIILIGAGQGATIGSMWLASECRLYRDTTPLAFRPMLAGDPEGKDVACAIWLGVSPRLGTADVGPRVKGWTKLAGTQLKIPMAFVYAKDDNTGANFAQDCLKNIKEGVKEKLEYTGEKVIPGTAVTNSKLLGVNGTEDWIVKSYLAPVLEKRGSKEWAERKVREGRYFYAPKKDASGTPLPVLPAAKLSGEEVPVVNISTFYPGR